MTATATRPGPANSQTNDEGHRWYVFGEGEDAERFVSVTTALSLVGDREGLVRWAAGLAADAALAELPKLTASALVKDCGNTYKRSCAHDFRERCANCPCERCPTCLRKWLANRHYFHSSRRAAEGAAVHDVAEEYVVSEGFVRPHDPAVAVYVEQWLAWVKDYGLTPDDWEMTEATVINREYGYAGTLDGILTIHADRSEAAAELVAMILGLPLSQVVGRSVRVLVDTKTREKEGGRLFTDHSLQLSGYRNAQVVRLRDGQELPMPATDGAIIVQVRPDGYLCRPVVTDDRTFGAFLSALSYARWHFEYSAASISSRSFRVPPEPKPSRPAAKSTPAPAKAAPAPAATKTAPRKATPAAKALPTDATSYDRSVTEVELPLGDVSPIKRAAAKQSATLASMRRAPNDRYTSIPDDQIPF